MTLQQATNAAQHIVEDRRGADYYHDTQELAKYLQGALNISDQSALQLAKDINNDRHGANYYQDPQILAEYLDNSLPMRENP